MANQLSDMVQQRLHVVSDMNADGVVTISDVWLWAQWLFFLPGDLAAFVVMNSAVGEFFEVTGASIGGLGSGVLSFCVWYVVLETLFGGARR